MEQQPADPVAIECLKPLIWRADNRIKKLAAQAAAELSRKQNTQKP
ncbi:MAG: hypothetical protein WCQ16_06800 [Verrucomicrobiae bacterium]